MGSTTSQLRTGQFLWTLKVGHYAQKIARKWPKTAKNREKRPLFKNFKMLRLFTTLSNSLAIWHVTRPQGYKQNLFFRFLISFRFWSFWAIFSLDSGPKIFSPKSGLKMAKKDPKMEKCQKSEKQFLFVSVSFDNTLAFCFISGCEKSMMSTHNNIHIHNNNHRPPQWHRDPQQQQCIY